MLSKRLLAIADCVPKDSILADIGTDHAFLPIYLIQQQQIYKAYACDVHEGPLNIAKEHIEEYQVTNQVLPILSDGLAQVPSDANTIVIAGMGWDTARHILENDIHRLKTYKKIIIQINKDYAELRNWISCQSFTIEDERIVKEKNKYYQIICFTTDKKDSYCLQELYINKFHDIPIAQEWKDYFRLRLKQLEKIRQHSPIEEDEYITLKLYLEKERCQ